MACRDKFIEQVGRRFQILAVYTCDWSPENWAWNLARFYGGRSMVGTTKLREIGFSPFLAVIVRDDAPIYGPVQALGGNVDVANRNIIDFKFHLRLEASANFCHSTSSRSEFLMQSTLLLGLEEASRLQHISDWDGAVSMLRGDIEGAESWECFERMVGYLNRTCRWLVLRNFENLPDSLTEENDLDVLTDDMELFSAIAGLVPRSGGLGHYTASISGEQISIDVRCLGDGYYPTLWEVDLLETRTWCDNAIPKPEPVHHFFSLLYHARLQKPSMSDRYVTVLTDLALQIRFDDVAEETLRDDVRSASILSGFMKSRLYPVTRPVDYGVFWNRRFQRLLSGFEMVSPRVLRKRRVLCFMRRWLPNWVYQVVPYRLRVTIKTKLNH
ncbi:MAG: hypothetical protein RJQ10_05670 [Haliea sp.]|uniref:hypothetical protein n=1 Tax=Haliea sp. TaxID=1932666 RepID=UPI0032EB87A8